MNLKTLAAAALMGLCASGVAWAQSGNSGSGPGGTNVDNIAFSVSGNQVVITADGVVAGTVQLQPGQSPAEAIRALIARLEASGGAFAGLQAQALRAAAKAAGLFG
ncbi:hypothetical protein SAMN04488120_103258 [Fontimonas thermophila]|uniref:Uncharacterized protein n=1 Tax=Fontimonas thermophila TaxID=1076937 RepID=A0A1I2IIW1_9GAMM|nr:hypothetical protein [Fontimonas thermophila]SFF40471.1 hypothetical protein SAMN04488120_103258 [Fontimonas thermophila]